MNRRPHSATATLEVTVAASPPSGVLTDSRGQARRFHGWIELAVAIEDWRTSTARAERSPSASEAPD